MAAFASGARSGASCVKHGSSSYVTTMNLGSSYCFLLFLVSDCYFSSCNSCMSYFYFSWLWSSLLLLNHLWNIRTPVPVFTEGDSTACLNIRGTFGVISPVGDRCTLKRGEMEQLTASLPFTQCFMSDLFLINPHPTCFMVKTQCYVMSWLAPLASWLALSWSPAHG